MSIKQQVNEAIKRKQYDKAIALLAQINDPRADAMRERIKDLQAVQNRQRRRGCLTAISVIALLLVIVAGSFIYYSEFVLKPQSALIIMCVREETIFDNTNCDADAIWQQHRNAAITCRNTSDRTMYLCMETETDGAVNMSQFH